MYYERTIQAASGGFGEYEASTEKPASADLWADEEDLLSAIRNNISADVFELGRDELPEGLEDIRGRIRGQPARVFGYVEEDHGELRATYFGISEAIGRIEVSLYSADGDWHADDTDTESAVEAGVRALYPEAQTISVSTRPDDGADVVAVDGDRQSPEARRIEERLTDWRSQAEEEAMERDAREYAVLQYGAAFFGMGSTPEAARQDAQEWLDDGNDSDSTIHDYVRGAGLVAGRLYVVRVTPRLAEAIRQRGGDVSHELRADGVFDVVPRG